MTSVEVFSLLLLAAGFLLLQVLQIWPLWIKLGLEGWHSVCSFLPKSNSAGEYPRDKGVERFVSMAFSFFCMFITVWTAHFISLIVSVTTWVYFKSPFSGKMCAVSTVKMRSLARSNFLRDAVSYEY